MSRGGYRPGAGAKPKHGSDSAIRYEPRSVVNSVKAKELELFNYTIIGDKSAWEQLKLMLDKRFEIFD
jgi:hypothetical protein